MKTGEIRFYDAILCALPWKEKHWNKYILDCVCVCGVCQVPNQYVVAETKCGVATYHSMGLAKTPKRNLWVSREIMKRMFLQRPTWNETNNRIYYCVLSPSTIYLFYVAFFFFFLRSFPFSPIDGSIPFSRFYSICKNKFHVFLPLMPQPLLPNIRPKKYA